ncbi:MAG TPA: mandelate racemase/muconate lactonizing enzyme family protein [Vicinamibacteria bacterium]
MKRAVRDLVGRRAFFGKLGAAAAGLGAASLLSDENLEGAVQNVSRSSMPAELKITDLRVAVVTRAPMTCPIIRIDTNQGISGYGEVRDGASKTYALMLKSRLLGENPCNVDKVFRKIKQFGHHARQAGGVCGVEMACWDLAGKAFGVPVYQMLGGKFRDRVRLYADTTEVEDGHAQGKRLKERIDHGLTFLKVDFGIDLLKDKPGTLNMPAGAATSGREMVMHPFTGIAITDKGVAYLSDFVAAIREEIGMEVPLASDHYGHIDVNSCIRLARAMEKHQLAWMEDMVPWQLGHLMKQIKDATETPILTGEDIYLKEDFNKLVDMEAVDMIHPDLASAGGILETKKIGDYAQERGVAMAMHFAGTPVSFMANVHCAAATENFIALEHHSLEVPWWEDLVTGLPKPLVKDGHAAVPDAPGLGIELDDEVCRTYLAPGESLF